MQGYTISGALPPLDHRGLFVESPRNQYREAVKRLANRWSETGLPSRQTIDQAATDMVQLRDQLNIHGFWNDPPVMVTATLDDGLGMGLTIIETYARAIGLQVIHLGLMQPPAAIIDACRRYQPDYLGLTILQFDTEDQLIAIAKNLPPATRIVAGGPVYSGDPEFARRTGTHYAARDVADFLLFMLRAAP